ncbi:MAG: hypothetical protein ACJ8EQ_01115 [Sphingomicrobium sp.]
MKTDKLILLTMCLIATSCPSSAMAEPVHATAASPPSGMQEISEKLAPGIWVNLQREPFQLQPSGNITVI